MTGVLAIGTLASGCFFGVVRGSGELATESRDVGVFDAVRAESFYDVHVEQGEKTAITLSCDDNILGRMITRLDGSTLELTFERNTVAETNLECRADVTVASVESLAATGSGRLYSDSLWSELTVIRSTGSGGLDVLGADLAEGALEISNSGSGRVQVEQGWAPTVDLHNTGSGGVDVAAVDAVDATAKNTGSGQVVAAGVTHALNAENTGSGGVDCSGLEASEVTARNTGSGSVEVFASDSVDVTLTGSGNVEVYGQPSNMTMDDSGSGEVVVYN